MLEAYTIDPEKEKNIHDIRVAVRRLDTIFSLLPKKARKPYRGKIEKYVKLLKANSRARDCDIIAGRLLVIGAPAMADLADTRNVEIARASRLARSLGKVTTRTVSAPEEKRIFKIAKKLVCRIEISLPLVLSDESRISELHKLRRDLRKLRYVLSVAKAGNKRIVMKKLGRAAGAEIELKELQNLLGSIHDCDVTIEYLNKKTTSGEFLAKEISNRRRLYQKFCKGMKK